MNEVQTSQFIITLLQQWGLEVHTGLAGSGIVAKLTNDRGPAMAIGADMDPLSIQQQGLCCWQSPHPGVKHGCGHDGHCALLLVTVAIMAQTKTQWYRLPKQDWGEQSNDPTGPFAEILHRCSLYIT